MCTPKMGAVPTGKSALPGVLMMLYMPRTRAGSAPGFSPSTSR